MGGILVTGCADGVARLWKYDDSIQSGHGSSSSSSSASSTRSSSVSNSETRLQELTGVLSQGEINYLEPVIRHLLLRLEGHSRSVTDAKFSSLGDRVGTASLSDGTVRVWSFARGHVRSEHIVLALTENDTEHSKGLESNYSARRRGRALNKSTEALAFCWTADDCNIVTLQSVVTSSSTRLKVWHSLTGDLLRVVHSVSDKICRQLCPHPFDPKLVLTCGEDAILNLWDVGAECVLFSHDFYTFGVPRDLDLVDVSFSPDGLNIVLSDTDGRVSLFGLDSPASYPAPKLCPEQYFSTDYSKFLLDTDGFAVDEATQLPVNEAPNGSLCNVNMQAYGEEIQETCNSCVCPPPLPADEVQKQLEKLPQVRNFYLPSFALLACLLIFFTLTKSVLVLLPHCSTLVSHVKTAI